MIIQQPNNENENNIIFYDETINEVSDNRFHRFFVPYKSILQAKRKIKIKKDNHKYLANELINLKDINGDNCSLLSEILDKYNENNIEYHWLLIPDNNIDNNNAKILVKKEQLLNQEITNKEIEILDYRNEKKTISIPEKVNRLAKKYHNLYVKTYWDVLKQQKIDMEKEIRKNWTQKWRKKKKN